MLWRLRGPLTWLYYRGWPAYIRAYTRVWDVHNRGRFHCITHFTLLQFEAAWVITNISSGSTLQTRTVIEAGAIPPLVQLLLSQHDYIREQVCVYMHVALVNKSLIVYGHD